MGMYPIDGSISGTTARFGQAVVEEAPVRSWLVVLRGVAVAGEKSAGLKSNDDFLGMLSIQASSRASACELAIRTFHHDRPFMGAILAEANAE